MSDCNFLAVLWCLCGVAKHTHVGFPVIDHRWMSEILKPAVLADPQHDPSIQVVD